MNSRSFLKLCCYAIAISFMALTSQSLHAEPASSSQKMGITVAAPEGASITVMVDGEATVLSPGKSLFIPSGAKNVNIPDGAIISVKTLVAGKKVESFYKVLEKISLPQLTRSNVESFIQPTMVRLVKQTSEKTDPSGTTTITEIEYFDDKSKAVKITTIINGVKTTSALMMDDVRSRIEGDILHPNQMAVAVTDSN